MKMIGRKSLLCRIGTCRCGNAHDSKGRTQERRLAKRREREEVKREINSEKDGV